MPALHTPDRLIEIALDKTGARGEQRVCGHEALRTLCQAFDNRHDETRYRGRARAQGIIVEALVKGFRLAQYLERHPEIAAIELPAPVFIVAPFRTGTTFLHRLLAQDARFRWTRTFEVAMAPPATPQLRSEPDYFQRDPRIAQTRRHLRRLEQWNATLATVHETGATLPEECFGLLETSLYSHSFMFYGSVEPYLDWLAERGEIEWLSAYRLYADQLRLLQWWFPGERWLLKNPVHLWNLDTLFAVFPDAHVVQTHRSPTATMGSFCRLLVENHALGASTVDEHAVGRLARAYVAVALRRGVNARASIAHERFTDVRCEDLSRDPIGCVKRIYDRLGMDLDHGTESAMRAWASAQGTGGAAHCYNLRRYDLDASEVDDDFAGYTALAL